MKLFSKYNRINITATILIFLAASIAFYFTLNFVLFNQVDEDLRIEEREIKAYVTQFYRLPESMKVKDQIISYTPLSHPYSERRVKTIIEREPGEKEEEKFRQLQFGITAGGQAYLVSVSKSLEETDDFIHLVVTISVITILVILIVSFLINRFFLRRLWRPFNGSLAAVKEFRVSGQQQLHFEPTEIDEFRLMNETLQDLTQRAQVEYLSLKTFSENASHEIQTPIAIVLSKLDLLIQDEALTESQSQTVQAVYSAIIRLSRLNSSLLLLAKIENKQYEKVETIDMKQRLEEKIIDFRELWQAENICIVQTLGEAQLSMNTYLAEFLLNNLLSNATKYNYPGGSISIDLEGNRLAISNTSREPALDKTKVFQRFYKSSANQDGHGLGLSVVRQICEVSGLSVDYRFEENVHRFTFLWTAV